LKGLYSVGGFKISRVDPFSVSRIKRRKKVSRDNSEPEQAEWLSPY